VWCGAGFEPAQRFARLDQITGPPRPATNRSARNRTRTSEVGARRATAYTTDLRVRPAGIETGVRPCHTHGGALPLSYGRLDGAPGRSRTRTSAVQRARAAVDTTEARSGRGGESGSDETGERGRSSRCQASSRKRHGSSTARPASRNQLTGRSRHAHASVGDRPSALAGARHRHRSVTTRPQARSDGDGGSRTRDLLVASEALCHQSFVPETCDADGWNRTTTARGGGVTAR
jgi:hypothetical protein